MTPRSSLCLRLSPGPCLSLSQTPSLSLKFLHYGAEDKVHPEDQCQLDSSSSAACTSESEFGAEHESEAEFDEQLPLLSYSAPAAVGIACNHKAAAQSLPTGPAAPSGYHSTLPVSIQGQTMEQIQYAQQEEESIAGRNVACSSHESSISDLVARQALSNALGT